MHPLKTLSGMAISLALGLLLMFFLLPTGSVAGDRDDHNQARAALESGQVLPLKTVLERLEREHPGNVLEVELERKSSGWVYEIKLLEPGGQLTRIKLDAQTAQILGMKNDKKNAPR